MQFPHSTRESPVVRESIGSRSWVWAGLLSLGLGVLQALPMGRDGLWWLQLISLALFYTLISTQTPRRAAGLGWCFSAAWIGTSVWWLYISLHLFGGLPSWMAVLSVFLLSASLAGWMSLSMWLSAKWRSASAIVNILAFASAWLCAELARGVIFTGFPWGASGYAHTEGPLSVLAPWLGVYGIGWVAAMLMASTVESLRSMRRTIPGLDAARRLVWRQWAGVLLTPTVLLSLAALGPASLTQPGTTMSVTLLQPSVPQSLKFEPLQVQQIIQNQVDALAQSSSDLTVTPETAIPLFPSQLPEDFWPRLQALYAQRQGGALVGTPWRGDGRTYMNSAIGLSSSSGEAPTLYRYDKHHLVPFGEFVPWGFRWFTQMMNIPLGDFTAGPLQASSFNLDVRGQSVRVGPSICYEDLFGEELAARFRHEDQAPHVLANLSNIAWFGNTIAIPQHLQISRMRALELQRPMIRATNTGATAIIDHQGHVQQVLVAETVGVLSGTIQTRTGLTPFAQWASRLGLWPLWLIAAAGLLIGRWFQRRKR